MALVLRARLHTFPTRFYFFGLRWPPFGWLVGSLDGWLAGCLARWLAGWLAGWLVLARWLAGWFAGWLARRLTGWLGEKEGGRRKEDKGEGQSTGRKGAGRKEGAGETLYLKKSGVQTPDRPKAVMLREPIRATGQPGCGYGFGV